jgi:hypothetical protein
MYVRSPTDARSIDELPLDFSAEPAGKPVFVFSLREHVTCLCFRLSLSLFFILQRNKLFHHHRACAHYSLSALQLDGHKE